ncbi:MAG: glycosyltransferase [Chitinophagales bacterium]
MGVFFSIVIPTYNRAGFIEKTIQSVLEQTYGNFEIIVVDDGSTDNTAEVMRGIKDPRVHYYPKENAERAAARNYGARLAKGQYINFFDSDDLLLPHHLSTAVAVVERHQWPDVFYLNYEVRSAEGERLRQPDHFAGSYFDMNEMEKGNLLSCNGVFLKKEVTEQFRFNEDRQLSASEDYELWLRIGCHYPIVVDNTITSFIVVHDGRSVLTSNERGLIKRKNLLLYYAFCNPAVSKRFSNKLHVFEAYSDSYIALHLVLAGEVNRGWHYLMMALKAHPALIFNRRTIAIVKHTLLYPFIKTQH